VCAYGCFVCGV